MRSYAIARLAGAEGNAALLRSSAICFRPQRAINYRWMAQDILINAGAAEIRVAVVEDGRLQALSTAPSLFGDGAREGSRIGDILIGRVQKVLPAIQAAFVDIGMERSGFLGAREARALVSGLPEDEADIGDLIREGDAVLVQIVKDMIGDKGARLSTAVTVPGRLCVLTPFQSGIALSRRINDEAERARLTALGEAALRFSGAAGLILRTNAYGAGGEEIAEEAAHLQELWQGIADARARAKVPALLYQDLDPVVRALRDTARPDTARILIDDAGAHAAAIAYCQKAIPALAGRIAPHEGPEALFESFGIEEEIESLMRPQISLPCGGWITIECTEALCAVDVNSGRFTDAANIEDMGLIVNAEAAREVGRQIRLRGIGGVVVIDFIHMTREEHIGEVLRLLEESLARDGRPVQIAPPSPFGLVELTRKRLRDPRERRTGETCACCNGLGRVRRPAAVAMAAIRRIEQSARAAPGHAIRLCAAPEVIGWIEAQGEGLVDALAKKGVARLQLIADVGYARDRFDVGTST